MLIPRGFSGIITPVHNLVVTPGSLAGVRVSARIRLARQDPGPRKDQDSYQAVDTLTSLFACGVRA
jgi:hypothetical protein